MSLKLNSLSREIFEDTKVNDSSVKVNGIEINRRDLVNVGRLVLCEHIGRKLNERNVNGEKYNSRLEAGKDFATLSKAHSDKLLMFCATMANKVVGKEAPVSIDEVKNNYGYAKDLVFLRTLAEISRDVISPIIFSVYDDISANGLMQWEAIPFGTTREIDILSNDAFLFEDSSWGSARSASYNYLYAKSVTLNPKPYTCQVKIKWYQDVVNGEAGRYYAAIMNGMWNKIYALFIGTLTSSVANNNFIPTGLTATTYSTANWNRITTLVAAVNGVRRDNLLAFGSLEALANVLPTDGSGAAAVGLQYGLGEEYFRRGYLPNASGVQLLEVAPVIVPGTQNSTLDTLGFGNNIYITAKAGYGYPPIYAGYYDGTPMTITMTPTETADLTVDMNVTATFDFKAIFGSKVGIITSAVQTA